MGKLIAEAEAEVEISAQIMEYYVKHAEALLAPKIIESEDPAVKSASIVNEPLGVLLAIEPWNFLTTKLPGFWHHSFLPEIPCC